MGGFTDATAVANSHYSTADFSIEKCLEVMEEAKQMRKDWLLDFARSTADMKCRICGRGVTLYTGLGDTIGMCEHMVAALRRAVPKAPDEFRSPAHDLSRLHVTVMP